MRRSVLELRQEWAERVLKRRVGPLCRAVSLKVRTFGLGQFFVEEFSQACHSVDTADHVAEKVCAVPFSTADYLALRPLFARLTPSERDVLLTTLLTKTTQCELAKAMHISQSCVHYKLTCACKKLMHAMYVATYVDEFLDWLQHRSGSFQEREVCGLTLMLFSSLPDAELLLYGKNTTRGRLQCRIRYWQVSAIDKMRAWGETTLATFFEKLRTSGLMRRTDLSPRRRGGGR